MVAGVTLPSPAFLHIQNANSRYYYPVGSTCRPWVPIVERGPAADGARCAASSPAAVVLVTTSRPPIVAGLFPFDLQAVVPIVAGGRLRNGPGAGHLARPPW